MRTQEQADKRIENNLEVVVRRMREACDDAERIAKSDRSNESKIGGIMTKFAWAHANATTNLYNALNALESRREWVEAEQAEESGK